MSEYMLLIYASDLRVNERSPVADVAPISRVPFHPANALAPLSTWGPNEKMQN